MILEWLTNIFILNLELHNDTNLYLAFERDCSNRKIEDKEKAFEKGKVGE